MTAPEGPKAKAHEDIVQRMAYHPADSVVAPLFDRVRRICMDTAHKLVNITPPGRETALMLTHLEETLMWASKAIAMTTPVDDKTAAVARVLPDPNESTVVGKPSTEDPEQPYSPTPGSRCECGKLWLHPDQLGAASGGVNHDRKLCSGVHV